ncbi:MAG: hypothetical protein WAK29_11315, partial [Terriglobales bacterium]
LRQWPLPYCLFRRVGLGFLCGEFFGQPVYVHGMLVRLPGEFVREQVIPFAMRDRGRCVRVSRKIVHFGELIVWALWHGVPPPPLG